MVSGYYRDEKMSLNTQSGLVFKKKNAKIDWRKIAAVDLDRVARDLDVYTLQDNIDHITFCNIESEVDIRVMDPNFVKLFKISQLTIEYLMHSQNYLNNVIQTIETQMNKSMQENDEFKKTNEKLQKDLAEVKKENKKRKKMIETQQTLMSATSTNYHQCAYCSKVFLNISYLQAHMQRRHPDVNPVPSTKQNTEIEKELEKIKDRLRITENELAMERNARLSFGLSQTNNNNNNRGLNGHEETSSLQLKQLEEAKNAEIKKLKEELRKMRDNVKKEMKEMEERVGKQSHVGWMKDDIDLQKDMMINQKQEIEKLNQLVKDYERQVDELNSKWKQKEASIKKKHTKELNEKDEEIAKLKLENDNLRVRLAELQKSIGKTDNELQLRIDELQNLLQQEQKQRHSCEKELAELKNRPPPITPRNQTSLPTPSRSPSPQKEKVQQQLQQQQQMPTIAPSYFNEDIYLPEYCPLTLKAVQKNPNVLKKFREEAVKELNEELDSIGIEPEEKFLSENDFKLKMNKLKAFRTVLKNELPMFNDVRQVFMEICDKYASQRLNSSLKSSGGGNRVTFKQDLNKKLKNIKHASPPNRPQKPPQSNKSYNESEETDNDVSIDNALESDEDDDTEPTKSAVNDQSQFSQRDLRSHASQISTGRRKKQTNLNPDEISDIESISQMLSERSISRKNRITQQKITGSVVDENRKKIEKQLNQSGARLKPTPNAVAIGFQPSLSSRQPSRNLNVADSGSDLENVSEIGEEGNNAKGKGGLRGSFQENSNSSSIWVSETNDLTQSHNPPNNNHNNKAHENDRPPTANSAKTSNYDSDEIDNP